MVSCRKSRIPINPHASRCSFENLPRRWVLERIFVWISHNQRMAKDYARPRSTGEALVHAAMTHQMVRRLARAQRF
jgi:transposase